MTTTQHYIQAAYQSTQLRNPTQAETQAWTHEIDQGLITPAALIHLGTQQPQFQANLFLAQLHQTTYNRPMTPQEMITWGQVLHSGADHTQIAEQFLASTEFQQTYTGTLAETLTQLYRNATNQEPEPELLNHSIHLLQTGQVSSAQILQDIAALSNAFQIGLSLIQTALYQTPQPLPDLNNFDPDPREAIAQAVQNYQNDIITPPITDYTFTVENATFKLLQPYQGDLTLDLQKQQLKDQDNQPLQLHQGEVSQIRNITLDDQLQGSAHIIGSNQANIITLNDQGHTVRPMRGDDEIYLGAQTDTLIFEASPQANGNDLIHNFQLGAEGDRLDFSHFLNLPNQESGTQTHHQTTTQPHDWQNGDILVISGYNLTDPQAIADLFGTQAPLAQPTEAAKAVIITADIIGDAHIWYLINQTDTTEIHPQEITQIATLVGINNLALAPFHQDNFN